MSLGHTFSSALHYPGPVTSPGTPIKAIQAKGCASPCCCCFVFFLGADEIFSTKHLSLISSLPFNTSWNECSSHLNLQITTPQVMHMKTHSLSLFTSLLLGLILLKKTHKTVTDSRLSAGHPERSTVWEITTCWGDARRAKMHHGLLCDTHPNYELQINLGAPHPSSCHLDSVSCSTS